MIWIYLFIGVSVVAVVAGLALFPRSDGWLILVLLGGVAAIILAAVAIITPLMRGYDQRNCGRFEDRTGRTTKFVLYGDFQWDCLTPASDGKWISTKQLRDLAND